MIRKNKDVIDLDNARYKIQENEAVAEKLKDAGTPGYQAEFSPDEAELAGAYFEDALSEADALDSAFVDDEVTQE